MTKMTDLEFAQKCEYEGIDYAVTDYGLSADSLEDRDSELYEAMLELDKIKDRWMDALSEVGSIVDEILAAEEEK